MKIFVFLLALASCHVNARRDPDNGTDLAPRLTYGFISSFSNMPFIASLVNPDTGAFYGNGVVVSANWVLVRRKEAEEISGMLSSVFVYVSVTDTSLITMSDTQYKVKDIQYHPDYTTGQISYAVALLKTCDTISISKYATLPDSSFQYTGNRDVDIITWKEGPFGYGTIQITVDLYCSFHIPVYDKNKNFCCDQDPTEETWVPGESDIDDYSAVILSDETFLSLVQRFTTDEGDYTYASIRMHTVSDWVASTIA